MSASPFRFLPSPEGVAIRAAAAADAALVAEIVGSAFAEVARRFGLTADNCPTHPSHCTPAWVAADLARGRRYFVAEVRGCGAACAALEPALPERCHLMRLAVRPACRGCGLGTLLVHRLAGEAAALGAQRLGVGLIADQTELQDWYRRRGFEDVDVARFPHLPFAVRYMDRRLGAPPC